MKRPKLSKDLNEKEFLENYYLKEELINFCRQEALQVSGGKLDLTKRIAYYLRTGNKPAPIKKKTRKEIEKDITLDCVISLPLTYSQQKRAFFEEQLGKDFHFHVVFQKWMKQNVGKTYRDACNMYPMLMLKKKTQRTEIDPQFEYNTYIRDFFAHNKGRPLSDAICCWNYKKQLAGTHRYESSDLTILSTLKKSEHTKENL